MTSIQVQADSNVQQIHRTSSSRKRLKRNRAHNSRRDQSCLKTTVIATTFFFGLAIGTFFTFFEVDDNHQLVLRRSDDIWRTLTDLQMILDMLAR